MVNWLPEDGEHVRTRSARYPGARDLELELEWVAEALGDPHLLVRDPDPRSGAGAVRLIGFSVGADAVITVIAHSIEGELWGETAWITTGADRREYWEVRWHGPREGQADPGTT